MPYVYSTLSSDIEYTNFVRGGNDLKIPKDRILIKGGAGVIDRKTLVTPYGRRTEITEEQYEALKRNPVFNRHLKNGFIVVQNVKQNVDKVAQKHMKSKDKSAQMTKKDFETLRENGLPGSIPAQVK